MQEPSWSHNRFRLGCRWGTLSPSRRHSRCTRFLFTRQPWNRSILVIRKYPYRPNWVANSIMRWTSNGSSVAMMGLYRLVLRGTPKIRQARRSETPRYVHTCCTTRRRFVGLRSFLIQAPVFPSIPEYPIPSRPPVASTGHFPVPMP